MDIQAIRKDFPILSRTINAGQHGGDDLGQPVIYLDSAATSQKPQQIINAISDYYKNYNANIHRGIHTLAEEATASYEDAREVVSDFINAGRAEEIIFTRNATESINLVAYSWARKNLHQGDIVLVSQLEHHANLVPWQQACKVTDAKLKIVPVTDDFMLDMDAYDELLQKHGEKVKLVAITAGSNVTGTIIPVKKICAKAHQVGALVLVDGAQAAPHMPMDMQNLDCDFFVISGHKMLGPTGIGVLYGKYDILDQIDPFLFGGDMILKVSQFEASWNEVPWKFEAGTQNIADVIAFKEAIQYLQNIGMQNILEHDQMLLAYAKNRMKTIPGVTIYSPSDIKCCSGILSFSIEGIHPHDIAQIFDQEGIAIRSGTHCAQPLMEHLGIPATARMSFYFYNTQEEVDKAIDATKKVIDIFKNRGRKK